MQKLISSHKRQKELNFLIIVSILILASIVISPAAASNSNLSLSPYPDMDSVSEKIHAETSGETVELGATDPYEDSEPFLKLEQKIDIAYTIVGIGAAVLILFGYLRILRETPNLQKKMMENFHLSKIFKTTEPEEIEEINEEEFETTRLRLLTAFPILGITLAELLMFSGRMGAAVWVHIGIVIALSLSEIFLKDPKIHRIYQAFMLLPVLRLINLSMPIFFETTLYTFVFIYGPLAIPVVVIVLHQRDSLEQIGITLKHFVPYMLLSVPLGFLMGLGEYLTIRASYLIPDLTFVNLLKLTITMVFFVGLVEELIFRSILQSRLEQALSVWEALLITSFMFGLMHSGYGTIYEIFYTGIVGLIMGLAFYKTKSLPFVAVLHGFVNVFLFGILPHQLNLLPGF
ncbi:CAAX amino terminal protease family protein [Methanosarcina horonobensis HB-1 = JCM 15518]|uniref:CAAX amino terminal protease family protein n=1 Tax=Methanosarcina horonobensis HB-1 = JCM 15518 TaxID=1434110 RepID=A0A0E3S7U6_9EURY|nr:CAAX amino terminal protease family protein [Methanosarcina horonobensis HB-1 = JCM 15518]